MNILPKKRWHVRSKDNIARVRRDEAKAAEEAQRNQERIKLAESEARTNLLRQNAQIVRGESLQINKDFLSLSSPQEDRNEGLPTEHLNLFQDAEDKVSDNVRSSNVEHDREQKEEREKYEKQIGYLTYLGQDTNEALGRKSWYNELPNGQRKHDTEQHVEVGLKQKQREDPLVLMRKLIKEQPEAQLLVRHMQGRSATRLTEQCVKKHVYTSVLGGTSSKDAIIVEGNKMKHDKPTSHRHRTNKRQRIVDISVNAACEKRRKLEMLRVERLKRESEERKKTESLWKSLKDDVSLNQESPSVKLPPQKYNSQFNPHIAKQNYQ